MSNPTSRRSTLCLLLVLLGRPFRRCFLRAWVALFPHSPSTSLFPEPSVDPKCQTAVGAANSCRLKHEGSAAKVGQSVLPEHAESSPLGESPLPRDALSRRPIGWLRLMKLSRREAAARSQFTVRESARITAATLTGWVVLYLQRE